MAPFVSIPLRVAGADAQFAKVRLPLDALMRRDWDKWQWFDGEQDAFYNGNKAISLKQQLGIPSTACPYIFGDKVDFVNPNPHQK